MRYSCSLYLLSVARFDFSMTKVASESLNDAGRSTTRTRRRVLHLLTGTTFGGAEEHALSILTTIREFGFEPCLPRRRR